MKDKTNHIKVTLADRQYPVTVKPEDETIVLHAAKMINHKISEYQRQFQAKDKQDYLAMSALMNLVEQMKETGPNQHEIELLGEKLESMNTLVGEVLKK